MKLLHFPILLSLSYILLLTSSCKKEDLKKYDLTGHPEFVGDFDYMYSTNSSGNNYTDYRTDGRYGMRIKKSGKVFLFKDGKLDEKGQVMYNTVDDYLTVVTKHNSYEISWNGEHMNSEYPNSWKDNFLSKIK